MIQNAQLVGFDIAPSRYETETEQRGSPGLTVRAHILGEILRNAQRWVKGYESPESKSKKFGSVLDCLLLTPTQWPKRYAVVPADAPKKPTKTQINAKKPSPETVAAIEWWDDFIALNPGEIISQEINGSVHSAINRLREDKLIADLIDCSNHSVMVTADWQDSETGLTVPVKALLDILPPSDHPVFGGSLWDLKTTTNASPHSFSRDAQKYNYALQGAFYADLWNAATGEQRHDFGHVVIENFHPFEFRSPPPLLSQRFLNHGKLLYQRALSIYCKALDSGEWPSYDRKAGDWPITDCDEWYLGMETLYDLIEEEESEAVPVEESSDLTP